MKHKIYLVVLGLFLSLNSVFPETVKVKGITYDLLSNFEAKVKHMSYQYTVQVTIPSTISYNGQTYSVIAIGDYAFYNCTGLTSITIPNSVTSIGNYAFDGCTGLTSITIPNSVESIGKDAFNKCTGLTSITIPNSVTSIGEYAFYDCSGLTSITIPKSVTSIGKMAFWWCTGLTSINVESSNPNYDSRSNCNAIIETSTNTLILGCKNTIIPNSVTSIGKSAFYDCSGLTSITIPKSVTSIGKSAFNGCKGLTSITIPNSVTSIEEYTFSGCEGLTSITIPSSVTSIGNGAFYGCRGLTSITIPNSVTSIGGSAFYGCSGLTSVTIPNSVIAIGYKAFYECTGLTSITIPNSVTSIEKGAFAYCRINQVFLSYNSYERNKDVFNNCFNADKLVFLSNEELEARYNLLTSQTQNSESILPNQKVIPANLNIVANSISFTDASGNNAIDAFETCSLNFTVENIGQGSGHNCVAKIIATGTNADIKISDVSIGEIAAGASKNVSIPIVAGMNTKDGNLNLKVEVTEQMGFGTSPYETVIPTKAFVQPKLQIVDYSITSDGSAQLQKKFPFYLQLMLQNTQYGLAENVEVELQLPQNVFMISGDTKTSFSSVSPGDAKSLEYTLVVSNNYSGSEVPIRVHLKEKHGKFAEDRTINLTLNQAMASSKLVIDEKKSVQSDIQIAQLGSAVDKNIPLTKNKNPNTYVLIIANEQYKQVASVPYALNDGNIFRQYCILTLGIPEDNIKYIQNATLNEIKMKINWLESITSLTANANVIVYYAGHGVPDESSKTAYLLPVDGSGSDLSTGYKLDNLYTALGHMSADRITVFMDACFSGSKRGEGMLASARGIALKVKSGVPVGNMVVFSAAQGDETAYPYYDEQHGMFTYFLLKKLQETQGDVTLEELGEYIISNVRLQSLKKNEKSQTPSINASYEIGDTWKSWTLNNK